MCELFALSSNRPATVTFSLRLFARRGGDEGPHRDGWGIAYYENHDVRLIKEAEPASDSDWVRFIETHALRSRMVVSHIRKATQGDLTFANTQPFIRELGGRMHVFAHNGDLDGIRAKPEFALERFHPVGETDSEWAFCALLDRLAPLWRAAADGGAPPALDRRMAAIADFAARLRALGPANFLYADGDALFVHGHRRRQAASGRIEPPGLVFLCRRCRVENGALATRNVVTDGLDVRLDAQEVVLVASVPLTDEPWRPLAEGEFIALREGAVAARLTP